MASSQPATSSPARSATSPDRFAISPQSRLRNLLATVDSDSDDDDIKRTIFKKPQPPTQTSPSRSHDRNASAHSSGDEERPRGRLAGRMQGGTAGEEDDARARVKKILEKGNGKPDVEMTGTNEDADSEDEDDILRPRGRFAARMLGGEQEAKSGEAERTSRSPSNTQAAKEATDVEMADGDDDEDEDVPIVRRRLKARHRQSQTPEPNAATPQRDASPGLFVTPTKSPPSAQESTAAESGSDADLPAMKSDRFKALVEKKRKERLAREAEEEANRGARRAALAELGDDNDDDVSDITDDEGGRQLTQRQKAARPSRKASKKAIEEMNRETQRMHRAMQLAHEAKTKKKIAKSSLFERFNFKPGGGSVPEKQSSSRPQTPASAKSTDAEMLEASTPPSSPPARVEDVLGKDLSGAPPCTTITTSDMVGQNNEDDDGDLPDIMDIQAFARKPVDKGKETATAPDLETKIPTKPATKRQVRVKMPPMQANRVSLGSDDDDDLVIVDSKKTKFDAIFDRLPKAQDRESKSLRLQRQLAHIDSPERKAYKKTDKNAMSIGELQAHLQQRAREQAKLERERRMDMLKAKGIHVQTEEERRRDREMVEDMVARARREAEEIMDRERGEAKAEKKAARGDDPLGWDDSDSDDDDYEENENNRDAVEEDDAEVELSGSEEEDNASVEGMLIDADDDEDQEKQDDQVQPEQTPKKTSVVQTLVDDVADVASGGEDGGSDTEQSWVDPDEEEEKHRWGDDDEDTPAFLEAIRPKQPLTIASDNKNLDFGATPKPPKTSSFEFTPRPTSAQAINYTPRPNQHTSPEAPTSVLRSAAKTFIPGMPVNAGDPAGLGLTQIFAGTMDDSQAGPLGGGSPSQSMPTFENFPDSQFSQNVINSSDAMVLDSQPVPATQEETQEETQIQLDFNQSQMHGLDSLLRDDLASQPSQMIEPTQDGGFQDWTPLKERFVEPPPSTVDTVIRDTSQASPPEEEMEDMPHESPLMHKRSRVRRKPVIAFDSEDEDELDSSSKPSVFNVMKDAAIKEKKRKAREEFDKKKSHAKEMVHEQADESEDEYAGLGGVDGEDSDDDGADVQEMIDDQTQGNKDDELKISALHAERERLEDAKQTDKLFNDITRGMLRRKRGGADYDLSDSDDGGEAKRRMKRRQFAKMQKALFSDERISKVAENPRNQAFLRTIEDIGSEDEMDFLFEPASKPGSDSQASGGGDSQEHGVTVPDSQPLVGGMTAPPKRAPANERRTKSSRKPATLGEIRETLSNLIDDPSSNSVIPATDFSSDDDEVSDGENSGSSNKENTNPRRRGGSAGPVVNRMTLKRQGSSNASASGGGKMAFFAGPSSSASANGGFKVPALLRKATTNSLISNGSSTSNGGGGGSGGSSGGFGDDAKIKKNAGKKSGVSYLARETDRRAKVVEGEKRREERKFKAVEGRVKAVGGLFGKGKFE